MARILIIDDEQPVRLLLEKLLTVAGHKVDVAADGQEALRRQRMNPAELVITDLFMPNRDGFETILHFRKMFPQVRLIAMSGKPTAAMMLSIAHTLGAVAVLEKPFAAQRLLAAVTEALEQNAPSPD